MAYGPLSASDTYEQGHSGHVLSDRTLELLLECGCHPNVLGPSHHRKLTTLHGPGHCWVRNSARLSSWELEIIESHPWGQHLIMFRSSSTDTYSVWGRESSVNQPGMFSRLPMWLSHQKPEELKLFSLFETLILLWESTKCHRAVQWRGNGHQIHYILPDWRKKISIIKLQIIWNFSRAPREVSLPKNFMGKHTVSTNEK